MPVVKPLSLPTLYFHMHLFLIYHFFFFYVKKGLRSISVMGIEAAGLTEVNHCSSGNPDAVIHSRQSILISFILQLQVGKKNNNFTTLMPGKLGRADHWRSLLCSHNTIGKSA